jgi:outer membrane protein assembly factor BamB
LILISPLVSLINFVKIKNRSAMRIFVSLLFLVLPLTGALSQSTQFRGQTRDGIYHETGLLKSWPEGGPECILTVEGVGKGYSSPVLADGTIYVSGMTEAKDFLTALRMDGTIKWQVTYGNSWAKSFPDTRTTPTLDGNRIYTISGSGRLVCLDTLDGREIWSAEVDSVFESQWHSWGVAESPLVLDNLVICTPAGKKAAVVAYDKLTGNLAWQSKSTEGARSYASAVLYTLNNTRYILASTTMELICLVPETGEIVWIYKHWQADRDAKGESGQIYTNNPTFLNNRIFLTRGYDYPCIMIEVSDDGKSVSEKWIDKTLDSHHHGVILTDGYLYGSNWQNNSKGNWVCLDWNTGAVQWEQLWNNKGPVIFADGMLYIMDEKTGNVGLVRPDPTKFDLVSSFRIDKGSGPYWAHPAIYDGKLLIRHGEVLLVYNIKE